ncbi:MAG: PilZ domain-containing protein [Deltaproteobacteria bacterium]|nr:PilZ domain-containing protein [Deltaproteobacteria bacterium]
MTLPHGDSAAASRRHPRARVRLPAQLAVPGADAGRDDSLCIELSIGGMRLVRTDALQSGTTVQVSVGLGEESTLDLDARVVWSCPADQAHQLGLAFENLSAAEASLANLVASLRAQRSWGPPAL